MKKLVLIAALALTVAGCSTTGNLVRPDEAKLSCKADPEVPQGLGPGGTVTDEENGAYLRSLRSSGADCRSKLQWVKDYLDAYFKALAKKQ